MQQHAGVFIVLGALILSLVVFYISKFSRKDTISQEQTEEDKDPEIGQLNTLYDDDIISIRKIEPTDEPKTESSVDDVEPGSNRAVHIIHVMAQTEKVFKGYELLQALLSQGLRFGEMNIFHRHQQTNGKGPVLFSLTSAVEPGTFDIHNMGRCVCPGLTLFMASSGNSNMDIDRFNIMLKTAENIARELDGICQDKYRVQLTEQLVEQYRNKIYSASPKESACESGVA